MKMEKLQGNMMENVTKQYQSISMHSGVASATSSTETSLSNGSSLVHLKLITGSGLVCLVLIPFIVVDK